MGPGVRYTWRSGWLTLYNKLGTSGAVWPEAPENSLPRQEVKGAEAVN